MAGDVIGRESELAILDRFLDSIPTGPGALLLSGDAGIGKTTVWQEGLASALQRGYRTLSCGPVEAETRLSYAALGDLLEPVLEEALPTAAGATAPGPRGGPPAGPELGRPRRPAGRLAGRPRMPSIGGLHHSRRGGHRRHPWMDVPSVRVLQFVVRRLKDEQVGLMTAARGSEPMTTPSASCRPSSEDRMHAVHVGPLSAGRHRTGAPRQGWGRVLQNHAPRPPRDLGRQSLLRPGDRIGAPSPWRRRDGRRRASRSRTASKSSSRTASRGSPRGPSKPSRSSRPCRLRRWM